MFAEQLEKLVKEGVPMQAAIDQAARQAGIAGRVTLKDIQDAVAKNPIAFPPNYLRLR
jgi:hypothetical protein